VSNRAKKSKVSFNIWSLANSKSFRHSQPYTQRFYHYIQANKISQLVWNRCKREWRNDSLTKLSSRSSKNSSPTSQRKKPTKSNDLKKIANKNRMKIDQQRKDTQAVTRSRRCTLEYPSHCAAHSVWTEFPLETPNPDRKPSKKRDLMSRLDWYAIDDSSPFVLYLAGSFKVWKIFSEKLYFASNYILERLSTLATSRYIRFDCCRYWVLISGYPLWLYFDHSSGYYTRSYLCGSA